MNQANKWNEKEFNKTFALFDEDNSGTIEKEEMVQFMKKVLGEDFDNLHGIGAVVGQNMLNKYEE